MLPLVKYPLPSLSPTFFSPLASTTSFRGWSPRLCSSLVLGKTPNTNTGSACVVPNQTPKRSVSFSVKILTQMLNRCIPKKLIDDAKPEKVQSTRARGEAHPHPLPQQILVEAWRDGNLENRTPRDWSNLTSLESVSYTHLTLPTN